MSLENLLKTRQLEPHETNAQQVGKQLNAICRSLEDARQETITAETRLEAAYRAIMQLSMLALWANGYRPSTSLGHHATMIQSLVASVGLDSARMQLLDTFRIKRNAVSYSGRDMDMASVKACIAAGEDLLHHVQQWLAENRPDLLS
jgi:hypothetical protein